jgi:hypothetical protein
VCSPRPNCLPGELKLKTEIKGSPEQKKNGSGLKDYAWYIFDPGYAGRPQVDWLYKKSKGNKVIFAPPPNEAIDDPNLPKPLYPVGGSVGGSEFTGTVIDYVKAIYGGNYMPQPIWKPKGISFKVDHTVIDIAHQDYLATISIPYHVVEGIGGFDWFDYKLVKKSECS